MALSLTIGGVSYTVQESILSSYPDSFFGRMLKEEWRSDPNEPVVIDRDGALFRHVIDFMTYKCLPRNKEMQCLLDKETLGALLEEADYYQLTDLAEDINELLYYPEKAILEQNKKVNSIVREYAKCWRSESVKFYPVFDSEVVHALQPFYVPSCVRGELNRYISRTIYKSSTTHKLNIEELLADATPSHFGRNSETVFDRSVRNSLEIKAELLNAETLESIANSFQLEKMSRTMNMEARPYKLVIYPEGGHFAPHRDTVRGDNHVGTAVCILKSDFTGGEFLVHSGGETMKVNEPGQWIAMFGDCMHEIRPVLSGVRVTLVYDIYCTGQRNLEDDDDEEEDDDDDDDDEEEEEEYDEYSEMAPVLALSRVIVERDKEALIAACRGVNSPFCITLQHLYPKSQSTMHFLKGGDRILFDTLSEHFSVEFVPIFCCHSRWCDSGDKSDNYMMFDGINAVGQQKGKLHNRYKKKTFPLFILSKKLGEKHLIFHEGAIEYTGNDAQPATFAYLVRGLFVTPKV